MKGKWTPESLAYKIDSEGFDYFFLGYVDPKDLPDWLQKAAERYVTAATELKACLKENGATLE